MKTFTVLALLVLVLTLTACGGDKLAVPDEPAEVPVEDTDVVSDQELQELEAELEQVENLEDELSLDDLSDLEQDLDLI
ncbi:hypothetical protein GOV11_01295 [Candidatus Woesearchaeota archaeon]|nr:hypothetical protein [Candidatus Woesearchaeota archaeon]